MFAVINIVFGARRAAITAVVDYIVDNKYEAVAAVRYCRSIAEHIQEQIEATTKLEKKQNKRIRKAVGSILAE